jgi:hypothetical protein
MGSNLVAFAAWSPDSLKKSRSKPSPGNFRGGQRMLRFDRYLRILCVELALLAVVHAGSEKQKSIQYISPRPGAKLVSPSTGILLRPGGKLGIQTFKESEAIAVEGSVSGLHPGRVKVSDDQSTLMFSPENPFTPGETVSVTVPGFSLANGRMSAPFIYSFSTAPRTSEAMVPSNISAELRDIPAASTSEMVARQQGREQRLSSGGKMRWGLPIDFPYMNISAPGEPSPERIFLATFGGGIPYLIILENTGRPLFYKKMQANCFDFKLQPNGLVTYFDDRVGYFYAMDNSYAVVDSFMCGNGYTTDLHDLQLLPDGHALLMSYDAKKVDMSGVVPGGKSDATVIGLVIQEIDREKNVVFEWRSWDHFQFTDATHEDLTKETVDYVHGNALELDSDGNILLSSRHLDEITKISRETGEIIWRMGGKNNQFTFLNDPIQFSYQHDIRRVPNGNLTLFDNGNFHTPRFSRAVEYRLDEHLMTAELVWQYRASPDIFGPFMGSVQRLPNGNTFICWGAGSTLSEVRPDGTKAFEIRLDENVYSYRGFRFPWRTSRPDKPLLIPKSSSLTQNYPNPFNSTTTIRISLPEDTYISLKVYDVLGREVATLADRRQRAGFFFARFNASGLPSGVYFFRLITETHTEVRKVILSK